MPLPIWASKSKDDSEVVDEDSVSFRRYGVKRVSHFTTRGIPSTPRFRTRR
jgi:hypothetical protein